MAHHHLLRRRFRFVADVGATIRPLTRAFLQRRAEERMGKSPTGLVSWRAPGTPSESVLRPQRRLQQHLLGRPDLLLRWMEAEVVLFVQEGFVIADDLDLEEPHDLLPLLVDRLAADTRRRLEEALDGYDFAPFLDEFWFCLRLEPVRLQVRVLPVGEGEDSSDPDVLLRRAFRAVVDVEIVVRDVSMAQAEERNAGRRQAELAGFGTGAQQVETPPFTEEDLGPTRDLLRALLERPDALDRLIRLDIINSVHDGGLIGLGPRVRTDREIFGPLLDRVPLSARPDLVRTEGEADWWESTPHLLESLEVETERLAILETSRG